MPPKSIKLMKIGFFKIPVFVGAREGLVHKFEQPARGLCYETFYVHNLRIFVGVFVPGKAFQPILMFDDKARAYSRGIHFRCSTLG